MREQQVPFLSTKSAEKPHPHFRSPASYCLVKEIRTEIWVHFGHSAMLRFIFILRWGCSCSSWIFANMVESMRFSLRFFSFYFQIYFSSDSNCYDRCHWAPPDFHLNWHLHQIWAQWKTFFLSSGRINIALLRIWFLYNYVNKNENMDFWKLEDNKSMGGWSLTEGWHVMTQIASL